MFITVNSSEFRRLKSVDETTVDRSAKPTGSRFAWAASLVMLKISNLQFYYF